MAKRTEKKPTEPSILLYEMMLDDPNPPELIQQRVYRRAQALGGRRLLTRLASHPGLADGLAAQLAESTDANVVRAWVEHPSRTTEEVSALLASEKRVSVLNAVAKFVTLDDDAYRAIVRHANHTVASTLLQNGAIPLDVRIEAAKAVFAYSQTRKFKGFYQRSKFDGPLLTTLAAYPEVGAHLGVPKRPFDAFYVIACPDISPETYEQLASALFTACEQTARTFRAGDMHGYEMKSALISNVTRSLQEAGASLHATQQHRARAVQLARTLESKLRGQGPYGIPSLDKIAKQSTAATWPSEVYRSTAARAAVKAADTTETLRAAFDIIGADETAIRLALAHPLLEPEMVGQLAGVKLTWGIARQAAAARVRDLDVLAAICATFPSVFEDRLIVKTGDPTTALVRIMHWTVKFDQDPNPDLYKSRFFSQKLLAHVPARSLLDVGLPGPVRHMVSRLLIDELGDSDEGWVELEGLAAEFRGTIGELLETVHLLTS